MGSRESSVLKTEAASLLRGLTLHLPEGRDSIIPLLTDICTLSISRFPRLSYLCEELEDNNKLINQFLHSRFLKDTPP